MPKAFLKLGALLSLAAGSLFADPTLTVFPSLSPNGFGSPSYAGWQANAIYALMHGLTSYGNPALPTYYQQVSSIAQENNLVTSFPSWMGQANPAAVFGPAFAKELGNRLLFGLAIDGNGGQFSISQLSFVMSSTDPYHGLDYSYAAGSYNYSAAYVGVRKGLDDKIGTSDDVLITSGANTQLVDALFGRGSGNAFWPSCAPGPCTTVEQQAALDEAAGYGPDPYLFTGEYSLGGATGRAEVNITPTPEPYSIVLLGSGLVLLAARLRRKRS